MGVEGDCIVWCDCMCIEEYVGDVFMDLVVYCCCIDWNDFGYFVSLNIVIVVVVFVVMFEVVMIVVV